MVDYTKKYNTFLNQIIAQQIMGNNIEKDSLTLMLELLVIMISFQTNS